MKRRRLAVGLLAALAGSGVLDGVASAASSRVLAERWLGPRTVDLTVHSPANNRAYPVRLLVPPGWSRTATRTWPVVYLLHGGNDDYTSWTRETDIEELSAAAQVLVVMPDAGRDALYADWHRPTAGPNAGKWETFHLTELWSVLRGRYRAGPARAVAGISAGGYGAITYAARHPGMFAYAAGYSAPLDITNIAIQLVLCRTVADNGDDLSAVWGNPITHGDNWKRHNPLDLVANLRGTGIYLSSGATGLSGEFDPNGSWSPVQFSEAMLGASTFVMAGRLLLAGIPATTNIYLGGTHSWPYWRRELHASWPRMMAALRAYR
ncbi:alpha/beta hydrolase [Phytohabitans rumicis]|uniref:Esterase n=1 Tax=Phytohabitans rumicis TaxID=1076125 RepID=A0A6V8L737_9ACTN|nr:alpha/beta hydrolase family protein [Phytohabitans rumicis]GFJ88465.1 hypothetical protein Prum_021070 [Phytohabitans rumicis]